MFGYMRNESAHYGVTALAVTCLVEVAITAVGCRRESEIDFAGASEPPLVRLIHPELRNVT